MRGRDDKATGRFEGLPESLLLNSMLEETPSLCFGFLVWVFLLLLFSLLLGNLILVEKKRQETVLSNVQL